MATTPVLQKSFPLDQQILGSGSALNLDIATTTDTAVLAALATNQPFPAGVGGVLDLAQISLVGSGGKPVTFTGGGTTTLDFSFSAGVNAGAGVFDDPSAALNSLGLGETPGLDLTIAASPKSRYVLLDAGYKASGSVSGSHPIGMLGSFTFGAKGAANGLSAVIHRIDENTGSDSALRDTVLSWKLPRHIDSAGRLTPNTWIVAEADATLAANIGASLGYNFNYVHTITQFGLSGDIGLKIDAAFTATFGLSVSGRYVVVVARETDDSKLRLQLFKLKSNGFQFGLNLALGVTGKETLTPDNVDDFISAVFGVHGAQIVTALQQLDKWTGENAGDLVAGLINDKALALVKQVTGIDPATAFDAARGKLLDAIGLYQSLPDKASAALLGFITKLDGDPVATTALTDALTLLASTDADTRKTALSTLLSDVGVSNTPIGKILDGLAGQGLLTLFDKLPDVSKAAGNILSILNGGVIQKLQSFVEEKLGLGKLFSIVNNNDFSHLDSLLVGRLSTFFNKDLHFEDLKSIQDTIHTVIGMRQTLYSKAVTALNSRYGADLAFTWASTNASTAVIDATFDMSDATAAALFQRVVTAGNAALDDLLTRPLPSVTLKTAVLSHELQRKTTLELSLPHFNFETENITTALASVQPDNESGHLLIYKVDASNVESVRNRFSSRLTMSVAATAERLGAAKNLPNFRIHSTGDSTWSYQLLYARPAMKRKELESISRPFLAQFLPTQFPGDASLTGFYDKLEATSEAVLNNGPGVIGDTAASVEVTLPGEVVDTWTLPLPDVSIGLLDVNATAQAISIAIQRALRDKLPSVYLTDINKFKDRTSIAPLFVWASIPPAKSFDGTDFDTKPGNSILWDIQDSELRQKAVSNSGTLTRLVANLADYRDRLQGAGLNNQVGFYQNDQIGKILNEALGETGGVRAANTDFLLRGLLTFEANVINAATNALKDMQKFIQNSSSSPTQAVVRLSEFAANLVTAFNHLVSDGVYVNAAQFGSFGQLVFAEASRAINPALVTQPKAMLTVSILTPNHTADLTPFLQGTLPATADIALAQRLTQFS